jgi:5-formyltetrahydrofolate cyclo-ligase
MSLEDEKRRLRERLLAERARLPAERRAALSAAVADRIEGLPAWAAARTVALYAPMGAEVDTAAIARRAEAVGKRIAWPRLAPAGHALHFAACAPGELVAGPLSTREPPAGAPAVPPDEIDLVVVPGVAFDAGGRRLGRGRGHYDATLAALPRGAARIGLAFEIQLVSSVPAGPTDAAVDAVVTERRVVPVGTR